MDLIDLRTKLESLIDRIIEVFEAGHVPWHETREQAIRVALAGLRNELDVVESLLEESTVDVLSAVHDGAVTIAQFHERCYAQCITAIAKDVLHDTEGVLAKVSKTTSPEMCEAILESVQAAIRNCEPGSPYRGYDRGKLWAHIKNEIAAAMKEASRPKPPNVPLKVDLEENRVCCDHTSYIVTSDAALLFSKLVQNPGEWLTSAETGIARPGDCVKKLPKALRSLVETRTGAGTRIRLSAIEQISAEIGA